MTGRLSIFEDVSLPAGAVVIAIGADVVEPALLGLIIVRKNIDRPYLGPHGWQASEHVFSPVNRRETGSGTDMIFGGEITRHLSVDMSVTLCVPALGITERHFWPAVTSEQTTDGINIQGRSQHEQREFANSKFGEVSTADKPVIEPIAEPVEVVAGNDVQSPLRRWILFSSLAAFVFLAIAIGLYFILGSTNGQIPPAEVAVTLPVTAPSQPEQVQPDFAARYQGYLAAQGQGQALLALGREALAQNATEVGFNSVTLSADRGFAEAKLLLAQWYDPSIEERGPVRVNPNSAATYYAEAAAVGAPEARAALQRLCRAAAATPIPEWSGAFDTRTHCPQG